MAIRLSMKLLSLLLFSFCLSEKIFAAACCGGGFATPSLISGDDKAQITSSLSQSEVHADVYTNGLWKKRETNEHSETFRIDAAHIFADRWQAGLSLPVIKRSRANESSSGLGDASTLLGYEYLPDWDYHPYRPKGIGFLQLVLPTGKSVYETDTTYGLDSRGRGFWALGLGTLLTKAFGKYDAFINAEVHRSFNKSINESGINGTLKPGWGSNIGLGFGYNTKDFRFGGNLTWSYEDAIAIAGAINSEGSLQRFTTLGLTASYLMSSEWATTLSYSDQTLVGSPYNTSLSKSIMLLFQRRWLR
jgi:hypothetical protein